jgi:hypothetical protein
MAGPKINSLSSIPPHTWSSSRLLQLHKCYCPLPAVRATVLPSFLTFPFMYPKASAVGATFVIYTHSAIFLLLPLPPPALTPASLDKLMAVAC